MCGVVGVAGRGPVNQLIYDSLLLLQHRGQDAAGISTFNESFFTLTVARAWSETYSEPETCVACLAMPDLVT